MAGDVADDMMAADAEDGASESAADAVEEAMEAAPEAGGDGAADVASDVPSDVADAGADATDAAADAAPDASDALSDAPDAAETDALDASGDGAGETPLDGANDEAACETPAANAGPDLAGAPGAAVRLGGPAEEGVTYAWTCNRGDCALDDETAAQPIASPTLSTTYTVTATTDGGCVAMDSATVWVNLPVGTIPADGADAYPPNADLMVQFGGDVLASSVAGNVVLTEAATGTEVTFTSSYDPASRQLRITPTGDNYDATIADYELRLVGGLDGIVSDDATLPQILPGDVVVDFTLDSSGDLTAPGIVYRSPGSGAGGVAVDTGLVVVFDEALDASSVVTGFTLKLGGSTPVAATVTYDPTTWTATLKPDGDLAASQPYTATLDGVADPARNAMATISWTFTTGAAPDTTPPTVTAVSPSAGATGASSATTVQITFSEFVDPSTLAAGLTVAPTSTGTPAPGTVGYDAATRVATFTPTTLLSGSTSYTVTVSGVTDLAGNPLAAPWSSTFTTSLTLFEDRFESGTAKWTLASPWGLATTSYHSATHSLADSPTGGYAADLSALAATSISIDLMGKSSAKLRYYLRGKTEKAKDLFKTEARFDGGAWTTLATVSGNLGGGMRSVSLATSGKSTVELRFTLSSTAMTNFDGVYVDDVLLESP